MEDLDSDDFSVELEDFEYVQVKSFDRIFRIGEGGSFLQRPCVHDGIVFAASLDRNVYAIRISTGGLVWKFTAEAGFAPSSPMISDGILYIGSYDHNMYAIEERTGKLLWKFRTEEKITSTAMIQEGRVYFGSNDYNLYCLDAKTGDLVWKFHTQGEVPSMPTYHDGMVLFGSWDRFLYCLGADTGRLIWKFEAQSDVYNEWLLTIHNGVVYVPSFDNVMRAVDMKTGRLLWKYTTGIYGGMHSSPLVYKDRLYAVNREGTLHCLTLEGRVVWKFRINYVMSLIEIDEDRIYFGAGDYNLHCVDTSGKELWKFPTQGEIWWKPTVSENVILFTSHDCNLYCVDKNTRELLWKFRGQGAPSDWPPAFDGFELKVRKSADESGISEDKTRKTYEIDGLEEESMNMYKSRITYQISTQYSSKGKYQIDSKEEEF